MRLDSYAENLGDVRIHTPSQTVTAGSRFPMDVVYRVGPTPITAGGAIRFRLPGLYAGDGKIRAPFWSSREEGVELRAGNALPPVNGKNGEEFFAVNWYFFVVVEEGELHPGDTVTVSYGQVGTTRGRFPTWAQKWAVEVAVDPDGTRAAPRSGFYLLPDPPQIEIVPDVPEKLELTIPSTIQTGEAVRAVLRARDHYRNVVPGYESNVETRLLSEDVAEPCVTEYELNEEGVLVCENLVFPDSGIYRVEVADRDLGLRAVSNPARVTDASPSPRLFWGDTHCHSIASGDTTINSEFITPEHDYRYARYVSDLDFCMVTDHSQDLCAAPEDWDMVREAAHDAYEPGRFVTFSAYESTHHPQRQDGDKNIYFLDDSQPCVPEGTTEETCAVLKKNSGEKVMVIPHLHVPTNWEKHDPELEHVVEVYSHWGCGFSPESRPRIVPGGERPPESFVTHALERGIRLGFIASADHSLGHPGDDFWWTLSSFQGGLAAIYSDELTREGIWNGLKERRCYGTTRARILLDFSVNGEPMGGEASLLPGTPRTLRIEVHGTSAIAEVEIFRNRELLFSEGGEGRWDLDIRYEDHGSEREVDYYFVHLRQKDGEQAWASPVWLEDDGLSSS